MVDGCRERGLSPMVTLLHFTIPRWMHHSGGWRNGQALDRFARFCEAALPVVADGVDWVCTINEPNMAAMTDSAEKSATGVAGARPAPDPAILKAALDDGIDVRGYIHWSALDNFEWVAGFRPTFGLIAVDRTAFERTVKPSARWFGAIARANRLPGVTADQTRGQRRQPPCPSGRTCGRITSTVPL
jgi:beta-glucosidase/6-phospho-beta-glucosidase/beta-galactosidase